jgi:putative Mg2+ transporter-C (MgtC) family protein
MPMRMSFAQAKIASEAGMQQEYVEITANLVSAWVAGSLIGLERSYRGRPAGFRTHALVCVASALLMVVSGYQRMWFGGLPVEAIRTDPVRMAQGIMTGIGFLGAGVIFKEGLSVRGLTTAASIWITAALGILFGVGFYYPALVAAAITLGTLSVFRIIESVMPAQFYAHHRLSFPKDRVMSEQALATLLVDHGFTFYNISYLLIQDGALFEYRMVIRTTDKRNMERLAETLRVTPHIIEFRIAVRGD